MNYLLAKDFFDSFLIGDIEIITASSFTIDGRINKSFYNKEEQELLVDDFTSWKALRPICFSIIKGKTVPSKIKITFQLSKDSISKMLNKAALDIDSKAVSGMYMHFLFENNVITIITGTTLNIFTMDKSLDRFWDEQIKTMLLKDFDIEIL